MRWNLLTRVLEIQKGKSAESEAEWVQGPVSPELLMLEMMAQTAGLVFGSIDDFQSDVVFAKVEQARFYPLQQPCVSLIIAATGEDLRFEGGWFQTKVLSGGVLVADAKILLANAGKLKPEMSTSITFHEHFMSHYQIRSKVQSEGAFR